jgi:hypothetical protein
MAHSPTPSSTRLAFRLPWPLPAVLVWATSALCWRGLLDAGAPPGMALAGACAAGAILALLCRGRWRRAIAALGFPAVCLALAVAPHVPSWAWLALLALLMLAYPMRAWSDAPFFPTPAAALRGLPAVVGTPAHVLDAGCGLGHGLRALRALWPQARLQGVEWSPLLALATRWACPWAQVRRGDMWADNWAGQDLVYLFQRPESMPRAWSKAQAEMAPGAWLVSLEFAVPGQTPHARLAASGQRPVWIYRPVPALAVRHGRHSTGAPIGR